MAVCGECFRIPGGGKNRAGMQSFTGSPATAPHLGPIERSNGSLKRATKGNRAADHPAAPQKKALAGLSLGALGVVFGDIGTSPLYALRQCLKNLNSHSADPASVLGILSLILWSLVVVVCVKYATFVLQADHDSEGGTLAMLALLHRDRQRNTAAPPGALVLIVLAGSALLYGDGVITPAISVLSAVEGVEIAAPEAHNFVVPVALAILVGLFLLQSRGSESIGKLFGPVMGVWFVTIAVLGCAGIMKAPGVLQAVDPSQGIRFLAHHGMTGLLVLGGVVLCFTGAEALFADLGHFGRTPIRVAWYGLVLPALVLNYFGEGALLLRNPTHLDQPFFNLVPAALVWPVVILATLATIIASQALISGTFTLSEQAIHMGYLPRLEVVHTSRTQRGQVYVAAVNYAVMAACAAVVVGFRSSERLGGAYGLAVIGTMMVTSIVYFFVLRRVWHWPKWRALSLAGFFLLLESAFLAGNVSKLWSGAWVSLAFGLAVFGVFWVWTHCGARYRRALDRWGMPLADFRRQMARWDGRHSGTGVFLTTAQDFVPLVGMNHWLREVARHEQVLLITVQMTPVPYVTGSNLGKLEELGHGLWRITASFGYMQHPDLGQVLQQQPSGRLRLDRDRLVCYLPDAIVVPSGGWWKLRLEGAYDLLRRNSLSAAEYFRVPPSQVVKVGVQLEL
jgi:KUP system potassium uptake protein